MEKSFQMVLDKIDDRIYLLKEKKTPTADRYENEYGLLMEAVSKVIGAALLKELEDLRAFVARCADGHGIE